MLKYGKLDTLTYIKDDSKLGHQLDMVAEKQGSTCQ